MDISDTTCSFLPKIDAMQENRQPDLQVMDRSALDTSGCKAADQILLNNCKQNYYRSNCEERS